MHEYEASEACCSFNHKHRCRSFSTGLSPVRMQTKELDRVEAIQEIDEELNISGGHKNRIVALLNDDSNDVGKVHLGVVHIFDLDSNEVTSAEDSLANLSFQSSADLKGELYPSLETWSQFCIDELDS